MPPMLDQEGTVRVTITAEQVRDRLSSETHGRAA